jgi:hypothetical protein
LVNPPYLLLLSIYKVYSLSYQMEFSKQFFEHFYRIIVGHNNFCLLNSILRNIQSVSAQLIRRQETSRRKIFTGFIKDKRLESNCVNKWTRL